MTWKKPQAAAAFGLRTLVLAVAVLLVAGLVLQRVLAPAAQPSPRAVAAAAAAPAARYLVLRQAELKGSGSEFYALLTANLLGRFGVGEVRDLDAYRSGDAGRFDALFVLPAFGGKAPPKALLDDIAQSRIPVVWMQHGARWLVADQAAADRLGWRPESARPRQYAGVLYKGQAFTRDARAGAAVAEAQILDRSRVEVLAEAVTAEGRRTPWALRSGRLVYLLEAPFAYAAEDDRYLVFADLLFHILAPDTPPRHRAMVRIEDLGPEADPARIRRLADLLHAEGAPFSMTVYARYRDPNGRFHRGRAVEFDLADRPQLVRALRYAERRGGVLVAHGYTHQYSNAPNPYAAVSGGDYEFFRAALNPGGAFALLGPLPNDAAEAWAERLRVMRAAWAKARLAQPSLFTTPHYAASLPAYAAFRRSFAARYERVTYFPGETSGAPDYRAGFDQLFPFETVDARGDVILPENMGFGSLRKGAHDFGRSPAEMLATGRRNLAVRDGFASFFYHWYEDPERLRETVRGLKAQGYRFVSPTEVLADAPPHIRARLAATPR